MLMLKDLLNWPEIMTANRSSGGHTDVMDKLFKGQILASYVENDYQGQLGYVYLVYDFEKFAKIVVISDYFGSCSGCDSWEDASDEDVKTFCVQLANNAHMFNSIKEAVDFLKMVVEAEDSAYYDLRRLAGPLAEQLEKVKL